MEGKKIVRSILVALLVLHLATMQCEAELFGICFLKCMPQCMTGKPITEVATCTGTCLMSCILPDHRITTKTQYSCSLGCANSACSHLINTKDEQGADKMNVCVDGCITECVKG